MRGLFGVVCGRGHYGALAIGLALIAVVGIASRRAADVSPVADPVQFTIPLPENTSFGGPITGGPGIATQVAVSPDDRNIVFVVRAQSVYQIWLRPVAALAARPLPGTEGGAFPFWSPDSRFIGFFAGGKLKKVQIPGGPPIVLCDAPFGRGGSWSRENVILFSPGFPAASGGVQASFACPVRAGCRQPSRPSIRRPAKTIIGGRISARWPAFLLHRDHGPLLSCANRRGSELARSTRPRPRSRFFQAESSVSYASGHIVFARDETLMAQPFDPDASTDG